MKLLVYIVALIIVLAIAYTISLLDRASVTPPMHAPMQIWVGKKLRPVCPTVNTSDADVYRIDFLKILGGIDTDYILSVNLSQLNVTRYLIEYMKLGLLVQVGLIHNGSVYELHMLPVTEDDRENLTSRSIYICFPPRAIYPFYTVRNTTNELFIKNASILLDIPMIGTGEYNVWINVVTPPPYGDVSVNVSVVDYDHVVVFGNVTINSIDVDIVGNVTYGPFCGWTCIFGICYPECIRYVYNVYRVLINYTYTLSSSSGSIVKADVIDLEFVSDDDNSWRFLFGSYKSFEGFAEIKVDFFVSRDEECRFVNETNFCTIYYHMDSLYVYTNWRGLRITDVEIQIDAELETLTGVEPVNTTLRDTKLRLSLGDRKRIPVEFFDRIDICTYINAAGFETKRCLGNTRKSFAGYVEVAYIVKDFEWRWGEIVDVPFSIRVEKKLYPPPYAPNVDLNKLFYGYLEEQVLRYISKLINGYTYWTVYWRKFIVWTLSTQIITQINICEHTHRYMNLINVLQNSCGSIDEKVEILSRFLSYLDIDNEIRDVSVYIVKGLNIVYEHGKAVTGYINDYPKFYNLTECCTILTDKGYMVVYDTVQNNVFSVLDRIRFG